MAIWPARWPLRRTPFAQLDRKQGLDLAKGTPYEVALQQPTLTPAMIEGWVDRLDGALDVRTVDVINNLIDSWTDQEMAALNGLRDDRRAEADAILALAAEQVARYQPRYEADLTEVRRTRATLEATLMSLTGFEAGDVEQPHVLAADKYPVESTLGGTVEQPLEPQYHPTMDIDESTLEPPDQGPGGRSGSMSPGPRDRRFDG